MQEGVHEPVHPSIDLGRRTAKPTATEGDGDRCRCGRGVCGRMDGGVRAADRRRVPLQGAAAVR